MNTLRQILKKINISGKIYFNIPMKEYTSFRIGGPADVMILPDSASETIRIITALRSEDIPFQIIGGGSNILVSDSGIEGVVINTCRLDECLISDDKIIADAGKAVSGISAYAADAGLSGMEFIYGMPGTAGGAVWMNARCYGKSICEVLEWVEVLDSNSKIRRIHSGSSEFELFAYKTSPFQCDGSIILKAAFNLAKGSKKSIYTKMREYELDRIRKGHFSAPSAGSFFKNNRKFKNPTGKIIDSLGLRGFSIGGAKVSDLHGNIIINTGTASAEDVRKLSEHCRETVFNNTGFRIENEIRFIGRI